MSCVCSNNSNHQLMTVCSTGFSTTTTKHPCSALLILGGESMVTGGFPSQRTSNAETINIMSSSCNAKFWYIDAILLIHFAWSWLMAMPLTLWDVTSSVDLKTLQRHIHIPANCTLQCQHKKCRDPLSLCFHGGPCYVCIWLIVFMITAPLWMSIKEWLYSELGNGQVEDHCAWFQYKDCLSW